MLDNQKATKKGRQNYCSNKNVKLMPLVIQSKARQAFLLFYFSLLCSHSEGKTEKVGEPEGQGGEELREDGKS